MITSRVLSLARCRQPLASTGTVSAATTVFSAGTKTTTRSTTRSTTGSTTAASSAATRHFGSVSLLIRGPPATARTAPHYYPVTTRNTAAAAAATARATVTKRSHYSYADGPGTFAFSDAATAERHSKRLQSWNERGFTVGIGGPVGSGKTALVLALIQRLGIAREGYPPLAVVTNDIFTQEDAQFLWRNQDVLPSEFVRAVETGGCPHAAIREDVSANLTACEDLTEAIAIASANNASEPLPPLILCESGGDNLAANFSSELADLTLYVIDVAGGDKVPRKGGPGITQSDLLVVNKIDLAEAVGADLGIMRRDADRMRSTLAAAADRGHDHSHSHDHDHDHGHSHDHGQDFRVGAPTSGPTVFASVRKGVSLDDIEAFILEKYRKAVGSS